MALKGPMIARFNDWTVLYDADGRKSMENHTLDIGEVLAALKVDCPVRWASEAYDEKVSEEGYVPDDLSELPEGAF